VTTGEHRLLYVFCFLFVAVSVESNYREYVLLAGDATIYACDRILRECGQGLSLAIEDATPASMCLMVGWQMDGGA
jgi:hypothetical protein